MIEDLGLADSLDEPPEHLAAKSAMVAAFCAQRGQNPEGQEVLTGLTSKVVVWTLHAGEDRGATWHDKERGIVWLLASRFHRSGKSDDAYPYFLSLDADGRLLPTEEDFLAHEKSQARTLARAIRDEIPEMVARAKSLQGTIYEGLLGGRIRLRLLFAPGDDPSLAVAVSQRIEPGEMELPEDWMMPLLAAVFPGRGPEEVQVGFSLGDGPPRQDEVVYWAPAG